MRNERPQTVAIGLIEKAHGVKGTVKVGPLTDYPPRFKLLQSVLLELPEGEVVKHEISHVTLRGDYVYVSFEGIDTREEAQNLKGSYIRIKREQVMPLEEDQFYPFEIDGFEVKTVSGKRLGRVTEVMDLAANGVLVVRNEHREFLVPVIKDVISKIDMEAGQITVQSLEGLLD
ncbi:16S rRNA processing protein RimM [candidate division KSB1 bacterium]|nr:16S rRNA processing protein RimM [candidate division KSB1 bacterium]